MHRILSLSLLVFHLPLFFFFHSYLCDCYYLDCRVECFSCWFQCWPVRVCVCVCVCTQWEDESVQKQRIKKKKKCSKNWDMHAQISFSCCCLMWLSVCLDSSSSLVAAVAVAIAIVVPCAVIWNYFHDKTWKLKRQRQRICDTFPFICSFGLVLFPFCFSSEKVHNAHTFLKMLPFSFTVLVSFCCFCFLVLFSGICLQ